MNSTEMFAKNIVETNYNTLLPDVIEPTKKQILDTLAVIIAGGHLGNVSPIVDLIKEWGGKGESTILGYGGKVPSPNAALVNGFAAVTLDFDDFHDMDYIHASRAVVPASLAMAERKGTVNGKDFIVAVALGFDLACRLSRAPVAHSLAGSPWNPSTVHGFFGAAAAASKILDLNQKKVSNTLGIAMAQTTGLVAGLTIEGMTSKGLDGGLAAKGGILAALIAERGLTGASDPIEGKNCFLDVFYRGAYRPDLLTHDLGKVFEGTTNSQKPYPCCRHNDTSIDATLALVCEHDIKPGDVVEVTVYVGPTTYGLCKPIDKKQSPENPVTSQFSIPWAVANAIIHREVGIDHFTKEALQNTKTLEMSRKVVGKLSLELTSRKWTEPAIVEIRTKGGEVCSKRADFPLGSPENPMSFDDVVKKFRYCCNYSARPIPQENQDKVIEMIEHLEDVVDVSEIACLLG